MRGGGGPGSKLPLGTGTGTLSDSEANTSSESIPRLASSPLRLLFAFFIIANVMLLRCMEWGPAVALQVYKHCERVKG